MKIKLDYLIITIVGLIGFLLTSFGVLHNLGLPDGFWTNFTGYVSMILVGLGLTVVPKD